MDLLRPKKHDIIHIKPKHIGLLAIISTLVLVAVYGAEVNAGDTVYITGQGAHGTYPYSNNPSHPPSWDCTVKAGQWQVQKADPDLSIIEVNGCWINVNNVDLSVKPPESTQPPLPTADIWAPLPNVTPEN